MRTPKNTPNWPQRNSTRYAYAIIAGDPVRENIAIRGYTIQSETFEEFAATPRFIEARPLLYAAYVPVRYFLVFAGYAGVVVSVPFVGNIVSMIVWGIVIVAGANVFNLGVGTAHLCGVSAATILNLTFCVWQWRVVRLDLFARRMDIDQILLFIGVLLHTAIWPAVINYNISE